MSILVGGIGQRSSFPGWLVFNCLFVFFFYEIFFFSLFWNLEWNATPTSGWEQRNPPLFLLKLLKSLLCRQGFLFIKSQPSSLLRPQDWERSAGLQSLLLPPFSQQQASCGLIGPSTSRHSKWWADSYRFKEFFPSTLDCMFQTKTGEHVPASLPNDSSSRLWDRICEYNKWKSAVSGTVH